MEVILRFFHRREEQALLSRERLVRSLVFCFALTDRKSVV